jgi:hypothetical protein
MEVAVVMVNREVMVALGPMRHDTPPVATAARAEMVVTLAIQQTALTVATVATYASKSTKRNLGSSCF